MTNPQPADFFLVPMPGIAGKAIRFGQWLNGDGFGPVQHAGIYLGNGETIEAMPHGAIIGDIARFEPESVVWSSDAFGLDKETRLRICEIGRHFEGRPYSWLDYDALALHRFHIRTPGLKWYINTSGHMICSQLVDRAYTLGGFHLFDDGRWDGDVTPGDLYNLVEKNKTYRMAMGI